MALSDVVASVVAVWTLDEASGTRADSVGSNDLTDNNTVGSTTGKHGNAADFERDNSEYLSIADNADLSMGDIDFTLCCWVQLESKPGGLMTIVSKDALGSERDYFLFWDNSADRFTWAVFDDTGNVVGIVAADNFGAPSTATWYLIHAWHSATSNEVGIAVNAGTANTASTSGAAGDNDATFSLGARFSASTPQDFFDGLLDEVIIVKNRVMTADERTEHYNGGTGVAFADWAAGGGFVAFPKPRGMTAGMLAMSGGMQ